MSIPKPICVVNYAETVSLSSVTNSYILFASRKGKIVFWCQKTCRIVREFHCSEFGERELVYAKAICYNDNEPPTDDVLWEKIRILCEFKTGHIVLCRIVNGSQELKAVTMWKTTEISFAKCYFDDKIQKFSFLSGTGTDSAIEIVDAKNLEITKLTFDASKHSVVTSLFTWTQNDSVFVILTDETGCATLYEHKIDTWSILVQKSSIKLYEEIVLCAAFHVEMKKGISGSMNDEIVMFSLDNDMQFIEEKRVKMNNSGCVSCCIRQDGKIFAAGGKDGQFRVFSFKNGKHLASIPFHSSSILAMNFLQHVNEYRLYVTDSHSMISSWSLYSSG